MLLAALSFSACMKNTEVTVIKTDANTANVKTDNPPTAKTPDAPKAVENKTDDTRKVADKTACVNFKQAGKRLIPSQTFAFDYEPFPKSCFVTFANTAEMLDEKDLPRGSTFHIYKDGKDVYEFEDPFDGQPACWVEGVGFEDLNGDGKTEVIIAGSCLSAKNSYPVNAIYENYQDDFHTYRSQNEVLDKFKTVKEIADFAKKNPKMFFNRK